MSENKSQELEKNGLKKEVGAVANAIHILRHLARTEEPEGVAAIARATNVSPSSAFNILRTLANEQIVAFDLNTKTYQLGPGLSELAVAYVGRSYSDIIQPELDRLSLNLQTLIILWQITDRGNIRTIAQSAPNIAHLNVKMNAHLPDLIGAAGRCVAAIRNYPEDDLRRRFSKLRWENAPPFESFLQDIEHAREHGWATDIDNLYNGITMIASAIIDNAGTPRFAISSIGISVQYKNKKIARIGEELTQSSNFISRVLFPMNKKQSDSNK